MDNNEINYKRAVEHLRKGELLFGKDGALHQCWNAFWMLPLKVRWSASILSVNLVPDYLQKPSVPSQTEYCLKSRHGVHECLPPVYAICWLDASTIYKVKDETGRAVSRAIYNVLGINKEGHKELLGMYVSKSEGANFWLEVLSDLQNRGVRDILICCIDGLKGFPDAIQSVFPNTSVQLCIVHQIRSSIKHVGSKHQKEFL